MVVAVGVLASIGLGPGNGAALGAGATRPAAKSWYLAAALGLAPGGIDVSCAPGSSSCVAVEAGTLLTSGDRGQGWTENTSLVPGDVASLRSVSCPTSTRCFIAATSVANLPLVLVMQGQLITESLVSGTLPLTGIACVSGRHCLATDGHTVRVTHDAGETWATHALPAIAYSNAAIGCAADAAVCVIVGDNGETPVIERSVDDGRTWRAATAPGQTDGLYDVACPSATVCYAVGADMPDLAIVIGSTDGGQHWSFEQVQTQSYALRSISCVTTTQCSAGGRDPADAPDMFVTVDGSVWTKQTLPAGQGGMAAVACLDAADCVGVTGGRTFATSDDGAHWAGADAPAVPNTVQALACPTTKHCVALTNDPIGRPESYVSSDGSTRWTRYPLDPRFGRVWDLACPAVTTCVAVSQGTIQRPQGTLSHVLLSHDGGVTWTRGSLDDPHGVLTRISCGSVDVCMAAGYGHGTNVWLKATTDGGLTWTSVAAPADATDLGGITCSSPTSCVLAASPTSQVDHAYTTNDLGATWESHDMPGDGLDTSYFDISCAVTLCAAGGDNVGDGVMAVSSDGGVTWTAADLPLTVEEVGTVVCSSATTCAATGYGARSPRGAIIVGTTDGGASWHVSKVPAGQGMPVDLACARSRCIASDVTAWGAPGIFDGRP